MSDLSGIVNEQRREIARLKHSLELTDHALKLSAEQIATLTETVERLTRERDEARSEASTNKVLHTAAKCSYEIVKADNAAILNACKWLWDALGGSRPDFTGLLSEWESATATMNSEHPGQAILDRLSKLERVASGLQRMLDSHFTDGTSAKETWEALAALNPQEPTNA